MSVRPEEIPSGFETDLGVMLPNLQYRQNLARLVPEHSDQPLFLVWSFSLTVGQQRTFYCDGGVPDKWQVSTNPVTGVRLYVWNGPQASGDPIIIGGGGYVRLPAMSEFITIQSNLGTSAGNVIAWRKYVAVEISTGIA